MKLNSGWNRKWTAVSSFTLWPLYLVTYGYFRPLLGTWWLRGIMTECLGVIGELFPWGMWPGVTWASSSCGWGSAGCWADPILSSCWGGRPLVGVGWDGHTVVIGKCGLRSSALLTLLCLLSLFRPLGAEYRLSVLGVLAYLFASSLTFSPHQYSFLSFFLVLFFFHSSTPAILWIIKWNKWMKQKH